MGTSLSSPGYGGAWPPARFALERLRVEGHGVRRRPGRGEGPAVLYIHGLGESGLCFERLLCLPELTAWQQVAPDLLGYGLSTWPETPRDVDRHAEDLVHLLERLDLTSVVIVGHSMGGVIGTRLCELLATQDDTPRIAGFVNVEGNISPPDCAFSSLVAGFALDDWLEHGIEALMAHIDALSGPSFGTESRAVLRAYQASIQLADPRTFLRNSRDLVRLSADGGLADRLARLELPTIYLHGSPRGTGAESLGHLARVGVAAEAFTPAGHWPFLDHPHAFAARLAAFLGALETRS